MRQGPRRGTLPDRADALGDVLGKIADPLQIAGHADSANNSAQILRHGLALGDERDRPVVELALPGIHDGVVGNDALSQGIVGRKQRLRRRANHRTGEIAHVADQPVDVFEFLVEGRDGMLAHRFLLVVGRPGQPNRPVM